LLDCRGWIAWPALPVEHLVQSCLVNSQLLAQRNVFGDVNWWLLGPSQGLNNLAVVYTQQGRAQEALQLLQAAVMAAPTYAEAYNNLGVLQVRGRLVGNAGQYRPRKPAQ
jgi:tetratricopeptide (TPR) repeat protein